MLSPVLNGATSSLLFTRMCFSPQITNGMSRTGTPTRVAISYLTGWHKCRMDHQGGEEVARDHHLILAALQDPGEVPAAGAEEVITSLMLSQDTIPAPRGEERRSNWYRCKICRYLGILISKSFREHQLIFANLFEVVLDLFPAVSHCGEWGHSREFAKHPYLLKSKL